MIVGGNLSQWEKVREGEWSMEEDSLLERVTAAAEDAWTATPPLARSNRSIKRAEKTGGYAAFASHFSSIPHKLRRVHLAETSPVGFEYGA